MDLPRRNGDLAFDAPWQSTVLALTAAVVEHAFGGGREPFRLQLIKAIAADPGRSTGRSIVTVRLGWLCDTLELAVPSRSWALCSGSGRMRPRLARAQSHPCGRGPAAPSCCDLAVRPAPLHRRGGR
jgi:hypothetical protein